MRKVLLACVVVAVGLGCALADDTPGEEAIREAITVLEGRKAQVEKKEDKDKIARAIGDLEKLLPAAKKDGEQAKGDADLVKLITPAALKKKFAGKAAFNAKTGELLLVYDFKDKAQLKDFDLGDAKPVMKPGALRVGPADQIQHIASFKTLGVTGRIVIENVGAGKGQNYVKTSEGLRFWVHPGDAVWTGFTLAAKKEDLSSTKALLKDDVSGKAMEFSWTIEANKTVLKVGVHQLSGRADTPLAGHLELNGGVGGLVLSPLTLRGTVDPEWARGFFKE